LGVIALKYPIYTHAPKKIIVILRGP